MTKAGERTVQQVIKERLEQVGSSLLGQYSSHYPRQDGTFGGNVMEAVAYVAGEPWTDKPECACPVITQLLNTWDCWLPLSFDRERLLKPLIPRIVGTRSTAAAEERRSLMAANWLIRELAPAWLHAAKLEAQARRLQVLPEFMSKAQHQSLAPVLLAVQSDADSVIKDLVQASKDSVGAAVGRLTYAAAASWADVVGSESADAAGVDAMCDAAAWSNVEVAVGAAKSAVHAAATVLAWRAAWEEALDVIAPGSNPMALGDDDDDDLLEAEVAAFQAFKETTLMVSARSAARAAARTALKPLVVTWQRSAFSLVERMCAA